MATTQVEMKTQYGFGTAGHGDLQKQFATTLTEYPPDEAEKLQQEVVDGTQSGNPDIGSVSMDYVDAPDITKFHPDRGWPAGGTTNPTDITVGPEAKASGAGSQTSPSQTSAKTSKQKIGDYIFGKSSKD